MERLALLFAMLVVAGCVSHEQNDRVSKWATEAREFERKDVRAEVEERFRAGDFRFKAWLKHATDTFVILPGVSETEAGSLREVSLAVGEVLYIEDMPPFFVGDMQHWEYRTASLFDYMQRFNRVLLEKLEREGRVQKKANKAPEPTPTSVMPRANERRTE